MYFDSHCHLTDARFADDTDTVIARARAAGVEGLVTVASDVADAKAALALAATRESVWATAGIHPHVAHTATPGALDELRALAASPHCVAIGETGLDYHYMLSPRAAQRRLFEAQLALGVELGMPVIVHSRAADDDTIAALRAAPAGLSAVLHCFTGGRALLEAALALDCHVSFTGLITFRNYHGAELLRAVPVQRLMLETDSPYLAPVPRRGRRNEPAFLPDVAAVAATIRGVTDAELALATTRNAYAFYGLDLPSAA